METVLRPFLIAKTHCFQCICRVNSLARAMCTISNPRAETRVDPGCHVAIVMTFERLWSGESD